MASILAAPTRWVLSLLSENSDRDFSRYDAYLDTLPVLFLRDGGQKLTQTLPVQPPRQDTGQSEFETRTEFGNWFAQGDFSHGMAQRFYHQPGRDVAKYLHAEGFDISEPGILRHLNSMSAADSSNLTDVGKLEEFDDLVFLTQGSSVWRGPAGAIFGTWTEENPQAGEVAADVLDLSSSGAYLFAAVGVNGIHFRTTGAVWDHLADSTPTDVDTGDTRVVRWLKDRLMVVGAAGRSLYEVVVSDGVAADATPTAIRTLPSGWEFVDLFEAGPFILAPAVSETSGLSRVYAFGLNSGATAIEEKASTLMPKGTLIYAGVGAQGRIFLGGGKINSGAGKNPCLFEALSNETGELQILLVAEEDDGDTADLAVRCFETLPESIIFGWGRGNAGVFGRYVGLAQYNLARNAFSMYQQQGAPATDRSITDVIRYRGRTAFGMSGGGLQVENIGTPVSEAFLITSVADWNTTSKKVWDLFEVSHNALPVGTSIDVDYTKKNPDQEEWQDAFVSGTPGSAGASARVEDVEARLLTLKLTSTATATDSPELTAFGVRSMPAPDETEWRLTRTIRVLDEDRKDVRAEPVHQDPRTMRAQLQDLAHTFTTVYEPGVTWIAYVEDIAEVEPANAQVSETAGTSEREAYYLELRMVARRAA